MIPVGEEAGFTGFVDLVKMKAFVYAEGGKSTETDIPADHLERAKEYREKLVEAAAETDDELLAKYLEEGSLDEDKMLKALRAGHQRGHDHPGPVRGGDEEHRQPSAARPDRQGVPVARRPCAR